jgi:hypothetical protein
VLGGIGWHPLAGKWDYAQSAVRFFHDVFPELLNNPGVRTESIGKNLSAID